MQYISPLNVLGKTGCLKHKSFMEQHYFLCEYNRQLMLSLVFKVVVLANISISTPI